MHPMTLANLQSAFAGESQAHMRYLIYADKSEGDGFPNVARLFRAIAYAEQIHASNHFRVMRDAVGAAQTVAGAGFGLGATADNLAIAIEGEDFEIAEMYPAYMATADFQGEKQASRTCNWAWQAEKIHSALYNDAKSAVESAQDLPDTAVHICSNCGHTVLGEAPERCPICKVDRSKYKEF